MIRPTGNDSLALHFWHRLGMWFIAFVIAACLYPLAIRSHYWRFHQRDFRHDKWLALVQVITMAEVTILGVSGNPFWADEGLASERREKPFLNSMPR